MYLTKLMISLSLVLSLLVSCSPKIQIGPSELPAAQADVAPLPKPSAKLTKEQFSALPRDVREALVKRERQWEVIYQRYLQSR